MLSKLVSIYPLTFGSARAGGLWIQAAFLGQWHYGGGCGSQLWTQVQALSAPALLSFAGDTAERVLSAGSPTS